MMNRPLWLNDEQVAGLLDYDTIYKAVRAALTCHAQGDFIQPLKPYLRPLGRENEYRGGRFIAMPAYLGGDFQMAGIKFIAGFPANIEIGLARASGTLQLNSTETGQTLAIMECATLSARRTAAIAMIGIEHLAPRRPLKVAVIGAGPIGRTVIEALSAIHYGRISEIRLCDTKLERAENIANILSGSEFPAIHCLSSAEHAVQNADVVITATTGTKEYLERAWLGQGWLMIALSLDDATPELFLSADKVIVDDIEQSCREEKLLHRLVRSGQYCRDKISAELGQVTTGLRHGRTSDQENIYLNPMGMAIEDIAVATVAYRKAIQSHIGQYLN